MKTTVFCLWLVAGDGSDSPYGHYMKKFDQEIPRLHLGEMTRLPEGTTDHYKVTGIWHDDPLTGNMITYHLEAFSLEEVAARKYHKKLEENGYTWNPN